jgi:glycine amidinotransferase|eukprot:TRINITY_DN56728_c0_g1_i1.p1 TRINITY_DN56728_c0_g1~~TRINITY_DN56728_c0_g1_i1.p1  ORF type:complete len:423 (-),score=74.73 TRINITY_DN56728_c0_g1_i1:156-1367(-)
MELTSTFGVVESWNEWDSLREVWVGTLENKNLELPTEDAAHRKASNYQKYKWPLRAPLNVTSALSEAKVQLDNYVETLKGEGIIVQRPTVFPTNESLKTPLWTIDRMGGFTCPRDVFFVAGKQVIEAPMSLKSRYFENLAWRDLMMTYYTADPRMRWTCAPKPKLIDSSFEAEGEVGKPTNHEIFFDAADARRFGKDVFFQAHYGTANELGREWVKRELRAGGLRVQDAEFGEFHFTHIDARLTPVDVGLAFHSTMDKPSEHMVQLFKENEWNLIDAGNRLDCRCTGDNCTAGIHLNVTTLGPGVCIVEEREKKLIDIMRSEGCDVIPIPFSAAYPFGGSLNCFSLDVYRHGFAAKSYFPTLDRKEEQDVAKRESEEETKRKRLAEGYTPRRAAKRACYAKAS